MWAVSRLLIFGMSEHLEFPRLSTFHCFRSLSQNRDSVHLTPALEKLQRVLTHLFLCTQEVLDGFAGYRKDI